MIILVAPEGMLGRAFQRQLEQRQLAFRAVGLPDLDITERRSVADHIDNCDVVINCAAYTNVDEAETKEPDATRINGEGTRLLAERCKTLGATLVHFSTDYVFDGEFESPYPVDHPRAPLNAYGRSKAAGELALEASKADYLLLRTSWLYAPWGNNFVRTIARLLQERPFIKVVGDQRGRPSSAEQLASTTMSLLEKNARGVFHGTDDGSCSWFEFAAHIAACLGASCDVQACSTEEFPRPAKRPRSSVLDISKTVEWIGPRIPWQQETRRVLDRQTVSQLSIQDHQ